ncbi:TMEM175 family protein [Williamsia sterculiae]|uniref:Uncharacterized membrane protein n=1 Tax=Williamsia sterculiae TaxID=1344003 RepID=A0A1N7EQM7_9NOCA|nr:TMEM175 family protein [Williamsia sterculiae]SIR90255.1 Uncharacterized membrane protein [Williamsia sterculiae]
MPESGRRRSTEGLRRLITFCDAVVAIALTLLVLPLVDVVDELHRNSVTVIIHDHSNELVGFLISFAVIWELWRNHHAIMENFASYDGVLFNLHALWILTIVVLPFATALISGPDSHWSNVSYMVLLFISISTLSVIGWWGRHHRELLDTGTEVQWWVDHGLDIGTNVTLAIAIIVAVAFPSTGMWPILLMFTAGLINAWVARGRRAWRSRHDGTATS